MKTRNDEVVKEAFAKGKVGACMMLTEGILDDVLKMLDKKKVFEFLDTTILDGLKTHADAITPRLIFLVVILSRMEEIHQVYRMPYCKSVAVLEKFGLSINSDGKVFDEKVIRNLLDQISPDDFIELFNNFLSKIPLKKTKTAINQFVSPNKIDLNRVHIIDSTFIAENKAEGIGTNHKGTGYKLIALKSFINNAHVIKKIMIVPANVSEIGAFEKLEPYTHLKRGDFLLMDRGFIDIELTRELIKRGIILCIPAKANMGIAKEAVKMAKKIENWEASHFQYHNRSQKVATVMDLEREWLTKRENESAVGDDPDYTITAAVIKTRMTAAEKKAYAKKGKNANEDEDYMCDGTFKYMVILCTSSSLKGTEIVDLYSKRWKVEEDFRQLKEWLCLDVLHSSRQTTIYGMLVATLLAYNLFNLYNFYADINSDKTIRIMLQEDSDRPKNLFKTKVYIESGDFFGLYTFPEFQRMVEALPWRKRFAFERKFF